jgi:hypothetical protein
LRDCKPFLLNLRVYLSVAFMITKWFNFGVDIGGELGDDNILMAVGVK